MKELKKVSKTTLLQNNFKLTHQINRISITLFRVLIEQVQ